MGTKTKIMTLLKAATFSALLLCVVAPQSARADGCKAAMVAASKAGYVTPLNVSLLAMRATFTLGYNKIKSALPLLSTDVANTNQGANNTKAAISDMDRANIIANKAAVKRSNMIRDFSPSGVACAETTRQRSLGNSYLHYASSRDGLNSYFSDIAVNKPGSPSEKGSLQYSAFLWNLRCSKYMDADSVNPPSSLGCSGGSGDMIDLDLRVADSLLEPLNIDSKDKIDAAKATILLLTDVEATDPQRGPSLSVSSGQIGFVQKMRREARLAVARDALSRILAMRMTSDTASYDGTKNSRLARYVELVTGQTVAENTLSGALPDVALAGEYKNATKQALASRLVSQKMLLTEFLRMSEQMIAVESVRLSMELEASAIPAVSAASFSAK